MTNDTPGLHLLRGDDAVSLASLLAGALLQPVDDPFVRPLVLAPGAALQRWLSQRIATATPEGIRAGVRFAHPAELEELVSGFDPRDDPWSPARLVWAVLDLADATPPGLEPLVANLAASPQRYANAARVARLLGRYAQHRPDLLAAWSDAPEVDALGLGFDRWQAVLWRELHSVVPGPDPVARRAALLAGLRDGSLGFEWPSVAVFHPRRLSLADVDLLAAVAARVRVDVYCPVPGGGLATGLAPRLGRRGGEALRLLEGVAATAKTVAGGRSAPEVRVHASHGPDRQVEVLREVLTGLFADDETLQPRDVAVLCPDVAALTPHLQAAFAPGEQPDRWQHPGTGLRVQVADQPASGTNSLYTLLHTVAALGRTRATASDLLSLAAHPHVARRFGFGVDELDRLADLVPKASIRWGLNGAHRARVGLTAVRQGTWQVGVQRLLVGEALSDDRLASLGLIATVDDVESTDIEPLGALAELVTRVVRLAEECLQPGSGSDWVARFRAIIEQLAQVPFDESWQLAQAWAVLDQLERRAAGSRASLHLDDALAMLDEEIAGRRARPTFGNGSLVVGSLQELSPVPHRVLCLVGLDERTFPRRGVGDGDDLLRARREPGDPDAGADDRQYLLDVLGSARDLVVVVYQGHSSLTPEPHHPPAGLVDLIESSGAEVAHESLQPFSPRNFTGRPTSFDRAALDAARALSGPRTRRPDPFGVGRLPLPDPVTTLELESVRQFLAHPARYFLRHRAGLTLGDDEPVVDDLPIELDSLQRWKIGDRVLDQLLVGHPLDRVVAQEWRRGDLPPGVLGSLVLDGVAATASSVVAARVPWAREPLEFHPLDLELGGLRLTGRAATRGEVTLACEFGNVSPRHLALAWLDALALTVQLDRRVDAVVLGGRRRHRLAAPPPDLAAGLLRQLTELAVEGLQRVLPLPPRVCLAWARARATGQDPLADHGLRRTWSYDSDATWARFYPRGKLPWQARIEGQPWAQPGEPTELGSLAALVWAPIVRADS